MSAKVKYRVVYLTSQGLGKRHVLLSEIIEAEDLETVFHTAKDWAVRQGWILKSVEELEESKGGP